MTILTRVTCTIFFTGLAFLPALAQHQHEIDSLLQMLTELPDDSTRIRVYDRVAYHYNFSQGKTDLARKYIDSVLLLSKKLKYEWGTTLSYYSYGFVDVSESNYSDALRNFGIYINLSSQLGDSLAVARGLYGVGLVYKELDEYDLQLAAQLRALRIFEDAGNFSSTANTLNSIAISYRSNKNYHDAIATYKRALAIYKDLGNENGYGICLQNIANVYVLMQEYDSAGILYEKALEILRKTGPEETVAYVLRNMGDLYEETSDYDQALAYNLQGLEIQRRSPGKAGLASALIGVGHMYGIMKRFTDAEKFLTEGIVIAETIGSKHLLQEGYQDLANVFVGRGNFRKAYEYTLLTNQWKDSIYNEMNSEKFNQLKTKYEVSEKDKQISLLAKEKEIQEKESLRQATLKKAFIAGSILVAISAILIVFTFRQRLMLAAKNNEINEVNFKHQLGDLEMKALRAQINPHFLFNCLNSINRLIVNGDNENASRYLQKFSRLVRLILENTETNRVPLENELSLIEAYIQLEELRFKGKIECKVSIDEKVEKENTFLPPMLLQPFVENAIWHGLMHKERDEQGQIRIEISENQDTLVCVIEDNGVGREKSEQLKVKNLLKSKSMGIKITEERLKLLSKERIQNLIRIVDLKDTLNTATGTRVEISIPLS